LNSNAVVGVLLYKQHYRTSSVKRSPGNLVMRHYTITLVHGFSTFKCLLCKHSVTTQEFHSENGNCRTQAARAMNEHAAATHSPGPPSAYDSENWRTR
jgi:hypothetical protein